MPVRMQRYFSDFPAARRDPNEQGSSPVGGESPG